MVESSPDCTLNWWFTSKKLSFEPLSNINNWLSYVLFKIGIYENKQPKRWLLDVVSSLLPEVNIQIIFSSSTSSMEYFPPLSHLERLKIDSIMYFSLGSMEISPIYDIIILMSHCTVQQKSKQKDPNKQTKQKNDSKQITSRYMSRSRSRYKSRLMLRSKSYPGGFTSKVGVNTPRFTYHTFSWPTILSAVPSRSRSFDVPIIPP